MYISFDPTSWIVRYAHEGSRKCRVRHGGGTFGSISFSSPTKLWGTFRSAAPGEGEGELNAGSVSVLELPRRPPLMIPREQEDFEPCRVLPQAPLPPEWIDLEWEEWGVSAFNSAVVDHEM